MAPFLSARAAVLLGLRGGPACGLEVIERLAEAMGGAGPGQGSVYPALKRLEGERLVRRVPPPAERRRGRTRVDYELTYSGLLRARVEAAALASLLKPAPMKHGLRRPSPSTLRRRLARVSDLIAFTEDLRRAGQSRRRR